MTEITLKHKKRENVHFARFLSTGLPMVLQVGLVTGTGLGHVPNTHRLTRVLA